jgi:hypothetical protein
VDDIPNTIELVDAEGNVDYDRITTFSRPTMLPAELRTQAGRAGPACGGNAKIIYRRVGDFAKAWGFGLDAAAQYDMESGASRRGT